MDDLTAAWMPLDRVDPAVREEIDFVTPLHEALSIGHAQQVHTMYHLYFRHSSADMNCTGQASAAAES